MGHRVTRSTTGPYAVQAAIADLHLQQPRDWHQITALYDVLVRQTGSAVVEMNRAIAVAELDGPDAGLANALYPHAGPLLADRWNEDLAKTAGLTCCGWADLRR